jgi:hypothetical protein
MNDHIDPEWRERLRQMPPEEKRAFLRAVMRLRVYCNRCPVKTPQLNREPCYSCAVLPGDTGLPMATVN